MESQEQKSNQEREEKETLPFLSPTPLSSSSFPISHSLSSLSNYPEEKQKDKDKDAEIERLKQKVLELEHQLHSTNANSKSTTSVSPRSVTSNLPSLSSTFPALPQTFLDCRRMALNFDWGNLETKEETKEQRKNETREEKEEKEGINGDNEGARGKEEEDKKKKRKVENEASIIDNRKEKEKGNQNEITTTAKATTTTPIYTSIKRVSPSSQLTRPHLDLSSYTHIDGEKLQQAMVIISVHIIFSLTSYIMDKTIIDTAPSSLIFFFGSAIVFATYFMIDTILKHTSKTYEMVSDDKKFYVLSNLIKSSALFSYTPMALKILYETLYMDNWQTIRIQNLGTLYTIPDFVSLILVRRMATTTVVHHIAVCVFNVFNVMNDYKQENICRLVVIYAIFSTFAYLVNLLLASRFLGIPKGVSKSFFAIALMIYITCCGVNWMWQLSYSYRLFTHFFHWSIIVYMSMLGMVVYDDIVLIKWLVLNLNPSYKQKQKKEKRQKEEKIQNSKQQDNVQQVFFESQKEKQEGEGEEVDQNLKKEN